MSKKRDFVEMETSTEISSDNAPKRQKISEDKESDFDTYKTKNVFQNRNETADAAATRTQCRRKLTAENVKTILRYVLANDSVLAMVQNTMKLQKNKCEIEGPLESTEPKVKEIFKTPWSLLTPKKADVSQKLLQEEYSEESASDEDYQPNEEELSDEDDLLSEKTDDLNSSKIDECTSPELKTSEQLSDDEGALMIALPETNVCLNAEVDKIAQRTRSKVYLNDTPLETLESSFKPPDITMDMYDTHCDDADWEEFICEFTKPLNQASGVESVADDTEDEKDPEYKVQEEEEEEEEDDDINYDEVFGENPLEDLGDEVKDLMTEILESAQQDKELLEEDFSFLEELSLAFTESEKSNNNSEQEKDKHVSAKKGEKNENNSSVESSTNDLETDVTLESADEKKNKSNLQEVEVRNVTENPSGDIPQLSEGIPSNPPQVESTRTEWMIPGERLQLEEQMRMHVQLLTQSYLLSHAFPNLQFINATSKELLNELKTFASVSTTKNERSAFYAHNLDNAVDIVNKLGEPRKGKQKKMNKGIPDYVKKVLASSTAFIYPELLPKYGFHTFFCGSKATFSKAEDNLIALGLEQFSYLQDPVQAIQEYLLPNKSVHQIKCRIKNSNLKRETENAITHFCKHNKLPRFHRVIRIFDPNNVKAPEKYPPSALPPWMESYCSTHSTAKNTEKQKTSQETRPKLILPRIQIVPTFIQELRPQDPQGNPQPLICKVYSVNEYNLSKGGPGLMLPKRINRKRKTLQKNQRNKSTQFPEPSDGSLVDSHISQTIKQEPQSEETSDDEIEKESNSDSSSECSSNLQGPVQKKNHSRRKRNMVTRSMSTIHEISQTELSCYESTESFHSVSIKEELLSEKNSNVDCLENNSTACAVLPETIKTKTLDNSPHKNLSHIQADYSMLTERSLRIVTSHGYENSDSEQSIAECSELLEPFQKFQRSISEDAVMPPASSSVQRQQPSDFSAIRNIICSEEKRQKLLDSDKTKACPKKACKSKKNWTKQEDQLIISNCQRYGINKRAFRASADEIGALTPLKVKQRFIYLLRLLSEKLKTEK